MTAKSHRRLENVSLPQQNYLEAVRDLSEDGGSARSSDIARRVGVRMPSVTEAVRRMVAEGLLERVSRSEIRLTAEGRRLALELERRHAAFQRFMVDVMGMAPADAEATACRLEHAASKEFVDRLLVFSEFMATRQDDDFLNRWRSFLSRQIG